MDRQCEHLGMLSVADAKEMIKEKYPEADVIYTMHYLAWPVEYGNTGGPFAKAGGVYGQAMTTFTIEAYVDRPYAVVFCQGRVLKVIDDWVDNTTVGV